MDMPTLYRRREVIRHNAEVLGVRLLSDDLPYVHNLEQAYTKKVKANRKKAKAAKKARRNAR